MLVLVLILVFIVLPLAELYVILQVGDAIGIWWTLLLLRGRLDPRQPCCCAPRAGRSGGASTPRSPRGGCRTAR